MQFTAEMLPIGLTDGGVKGVVTEASAVKVALQGFYHLFQFLVINGETSLRCFFYADADAGDGVLSGAADIFIWILG